MLISFFTVMTYNLLNLWILEKVRFCANVLNMYVCKYSILDFLFLCIILHHLLHHIIIIYFYHSVFVAGARKGNHTNLLINTSDHKVYNKDMIEMYMNINEHANICVFVLQ